MAIKKNVVEILISLRNTPLPPKSFASNRVLPNARRIRLNTAVNCVVVIPCLNEAGRIGGVVRSVLPILTAVIVVDDGSSDGTGQEARVAGAEVIRRERNQGKGAAIQSGLRRAIERGFE